MDPLLKRLEGTKQAILERLLPGERHVLAISHELKIRESAIRRHFDQLDRAGLVRGFFRQEGLGRPKKFYAITDTGRDRFPRPLAEALERQLRRIAQEARARTPDDAVPVLARDRVEAHRIRFERARTPLALGRAVERVFAEVGLVVRARVRGDTILLDCTSCAVLRTALHRREDVAEEFLQSVLRAVLQEAGPRHGYKVTAGEFICTPGRA